MIAERGATGLAVAFQVNRADVGPLFVDRLGLAWNPLSPLADDLQRYSQGSAPGSAALDEVSSHPLARQIAETVAQPDLRFLHRSGGGTLQMEALYGCRKMAFGREALVLVAPSFGDSIILRLFPDLDSYLAWWLDTFATRVDEPIPNFMPPKLALESLLYLLHAIDHFRRVACESLLNYAPDPEPSFQPAEFIATMERSVRSRDIRWLLPTFLQLTPGLTRYDFEPKADHMDPLVQNAFLTVTRDPRTNRETFLFGEAGRLTGIEFYRSWLRAVGFAPELLTAQGPRMLPGAFLAPTALSNHLIRLEEEPSGRVLANHQTMAFAELSRKLAEMLRGVLDMDGPNAVAGRPEEMGTDAISTRNEPVEQTRRGPDATGAPAGSMEVVTRACPKCGAAVKAGARFCTGCGTTVPAGEPAVPAFCVNCGNGLTGSTRFCPKCGAQVKP